MRTRNRGNSSSYINGLSLSINGGNSPTVSWQAKRIENHRRHYSHGWLLSLHLMMARGAAKMKRHGNAAITRAIAVI